MISKFILLIICSVGILIGLWFFDKDDSLVGMERKYTNSQINIMNKCGVLSSDAMKPTVMDKISNCIDRLEKGSK